MCVCECGQHIRILTLRVCVQWNKRESDTHEQYVVLSLPWSGQPSITNITSLSLYVDVTTIIKRHNYQSFIYNKRERDRHTQPRQYGSRQDEMNVYFMVVFTFVWFAKRCGTYICLRVINETR